MMGSVVALRVVPNVVEVGVEVERERREESCCSSCSRVLVMPFCGRVVDVRRGSHSLLYKQSRAGGGGEDSLAIKQR